MHINLISDTVTRPTAGMRAAMMAAEVGDDVFGQDPSVNALEAQAAALFGKEAALFCPSGTMSNQIAIALHTGRLDELICDHYSHVYQYETGGYAHNSGVAVKLIAGQHGKITPAQVEAAINPPYDWLPTSRLLVLENTCNKGGGSYYTCAEMAAFRPLCERQGLALHLDGARIFNALAETGDSPQAVGAIFDTLSVCLSKGLGAPVGSLLIGSAAQMRQARRLRKAMGGGMRQAGFLAAAGSYALAHHVERLREDHAHARQIGDWLAGLPYVAAVRPVATNIVIFDLVEGRSAAAFLAQLEAQGILASAFGPQTVRFVTHLDISADMMPRIGAALRALA